MPTIAQSTTALARRFVDQLYGLFGTETPRTAPNTLPHQSGNQIALQFSFAGELQNRIRVELDRLTTLDDINRMLEEDAFLAGNTDKMMALVENYEPKVRWEGQRTAEADRIVSAMLNDRLNYSGIRGDLLWRLVMWGDLFLQKELLIDISLQADLLNNNDRVASEILRGRRIGQIQSVLDLPAHSMFRNSNSQDRFDQTRRAFTQVPEGATRWYQPSNAPGAVDLPLYAVEHARWTHRHQRLSRYGRPALKSARAQYNKVEVNKFDLLLARHTHSTQLLVFYLNREVSQGTSPGAGITAADLETFYDTVLKPKRGEFTEISPDTNFILPGNHHVEAVGTAGQFSTSVPEDIYLQVELMMQGLYCHPRLFGYQHGSATSGDALKAMLWMAEYFGDLVRAQEWAQILRPLILWELWLHGIFTATPRVEWVPRRPPIQFADALASSGSAQSQGSAEGGANAQVG